MRRITRRKRCPKTQIEISPGIDGKRAVNTIHHQRIDVDARSQVIGCNRLQPGRPGLVDVIQKFNDHIFQGVGAVVEIGNIFFAENGTVRGIKGYGNVVSSAVLPVILTGFSVA